MKNNFNLRTFLTENKLTANSKLLKEEGAEDANYPVIEAFKRYGIDMSKDVIVAEMDGGTAGLGGGQLDIGDPEPAELVAKRFEKHRLDTIHDYESEDQMRDFPVMYEDGFYGDYTPEGTEFKLTYSEDEGTMWDIFQAPSGVSEKKGEGLKDVEDGRDIGGKIIEFAGGGMVDINIDYQRGKTKYFKDVPVEKAIDIVNQYIEQNDLTQASTYGTKRVLQVDDGDTAIDITRAGMSEKKGKDHDGEIISYIADTYIQNAKDGDKAYAEFRDLNIRDAVQDVVGILQDPKHPLHDDTKEEYGIVEKDKARGLFENKMKNNFDLKNFLTENKLTSNSRLAEGDIPFYNSSKEEFPYLADYPVDQAFQKAGVDMSKPVTLTNVNIHGYDQEEDSEEHDATKAASSLEAKRKEGIAQALKDYGKEWDDLRQTSRGVMPDYAFDAGGYDETPDGHDFKLVIEFEETDYVIVSQKS